MLEQLSLRVKLCGPLEIVAAAVATVIVYIVSHGVYNLYFHPLSRFPGPLAHRLSRIPYSYKYITGTLPFDMLDIHQKYGNIVRIAPDEIAVSHPNAWKEIMGYGIKEMEKARWWFHPVESEPTNLVNEEGIEAKRMRRHLAQRFSERAMREQEPLIMKYVNLLIAKLRENCGDGSNPLVLSEWFNFTTFDIIGDLAFGEPFGYLESTEDREWFKTMFSAIRFSSVLQALSHFPLVNAALLYFMSQNSKNAYKEQKDQARGKMLRRMEVGYERPDLIQKFISKKDEWNLSLDQLVSNAESLIIGGSETTASLLGGVTYYLLTNPHALEKLTSEIRSTFNNDDEINIISANKLTYTHACLDEAMRLYPPVATGLPRVVPQGGATVLGEWIPGDTFIAIHQWALYHRKDFFIEAERFYPERFLDDPKFANDRTDAVQPFHIGPRDCLGRTLAYGETRLILARLFFNFDLRLADSSQDWIKQTNHLVWRKGPLRVHLKPVQQ